MENNKIALLDWKATKLLGIFCGLFWTSFLGFSQTYKPTIDARILFKPKTVTIDNRPTLYYELLITNFSEDSLILSRVDVVDHESKKKLQIFDKTALKSRFHKAGFQSLDSSLTLAPASTGILFLEYCLSGDKFGKLSHIINIERLGDNTQHEEIQGAEIEQLQSTPIALGAPLGNGNWAAIYDPFWTNGHRRYIYMQNGKAGIPGRFAIDFVLLDNEGKYIKGNKNAGENWFSYGVDVRAVAAGTVVAFSNEFSESKTISDHPNHTADQATGNYLAIDIGQGCVAFYEHLKPNSILVSLGSKVKKGDIIAKIGFTGQSTGPHLHFHIANRNSPLGAEGVAFAFEEFKTLGEYSDFDTFGTQKWTSINGNPTRKNQRPAPYTVIRFVD